MSDRNAIPAGDLTLTQLLDQLELEPATVVHTRRSLGFRILAIVAGVILVLGTVAAFVEVESVIGTGLLLTVVGVLMYAWGATRGHPFAWVGAMHVVFCLGVFLAIFLGELSPGDVDGPLPIIGAVYTLGSLALTGQIWRRPSVEAHWACERCGYALVGVTSDRCPECGAAFEIDRVLQACRHAQLGADTPRWPHDLIWCWHCREHVPVFHPADAVQAAALERWAAERPEPYLVALVTGVGYRHAERWLAHACSASLMTVKPVATAEEARAESIERP